MADTTIPQDLGDQFRRNLIALRKAAGITQSELAKRMNRNPSFVCDLERGRREPTLPTLDMVSMALAVDPGRLVTREEKSEIPA